MNDLQIQKLPLEKLTFLRAKKKKTTSWKIQIQASNKTTIAPGQKFKFEHIEKKKFLPANSQKQEQPKLQHVISKTFFEFLKHFCPNFLSRQKTISKTRVAFQMKIVIPASLQKERHLFVSQAQEDKMMMDVCHKSHI